MRTILTILIFLVSFGNSFAQSEGHITYSLDFSSDNPEMAMGIAMMKGSTMDLYFTNNKSAAEMQMGSIMKMKTATDIKLDKGLVLIEMMGQNLATEITSISKTAQENTTNFKIIETTETKKILDFVCTKKIAKDDEGNEYIFWLTKDLKVNLQGLQQFNQQFDGTPLEFFVNQSGMNIHFLATHFSKTVDAKIFSLEIPEGYQVVTEDDLKNMGGM